MKAIFLAVFALFCCSASAQTVVNKPIVCMETKALLLALTNEEINEKIHWAGKADSEDSNFILFVNQKTKSWTMAQLNDKVACILGTGSQSTDAKFNIVKQ